MCADGFLLIVCVAFFFIIFLFNSFVLYFFDCLLDFLHCCLFFLTFLSVFNLTVLWRFLSVFCLASEKSRTHCSLIRPVLGFYTVFVLQKVVLATLEFFFSNILVVAPGKLIVIRVLCFPRNPLQQFSLYRVHPVYTLFLFACLYGIQAKITATQCLLL